MPVVFHLNDFDMEANRTESAPYTPVHNSFYCVPVYIPPPIDYDELARACDPRRMYSGEVRKVTMESLVQDGSIVGGPHCLPPRPILYADVEARERALRTDGTQHDGPPGSVSWHYRADMAVPRPIPPTSSVIRSQDFLPTGPAGEGIGIDPLQIIRGGTVPAWRKDEETQTKKQNKRFDPIRNNKKKASPKKRKN